MNGIEELKSRIHVIRGQQVMLDKDLAELYGVQTRDLNKAVKRNIERFPEDFMFQLTKQEMENLMFQNGTSSWGGTRKLPYVFTEHGVAMLSSVLRSRAAIEVNIRIIRAFVAIRKYLAPVRCTPCPVEAEVKRLAAYIEEILADQNEINEETRNAIMVLQAAVFPDVPESEERRIFNVKVKGFKNQTPPSERKEDKKQME